MDALQTNPLDDSSDKTAASSAPLIGAPLIDAPMSGALSDQNSLENTAASEPTVTMTYPESVIRRAQRAVFCSPFYHKLLAEMRTSSVSVPTIAENSGALKGYTQQPLSEVATESELMWLASVGILRREVDGQGLTDSFRLTPLGRRVVEQWQSQGCPDRRASLADYIKNAAVRWCRVPDWLG